MKQTTIAGKIGQIFLTWQRYNQKLLQPFGLTLKQFAVLHELSLRDFLYPADLAELLYADRPTITVILNNLVKLGYVEKQGDPDNKKRTRILITPLGKAQLACYLESTDHQNKFKMTQCLTPLEKEQLHFLLDKLTTHLEQLPIKGD